MVAGEMLLQTVAEILEVGEPLAQVRVAHQAHARARLVLHLLHRRLRGETAVHRVDHALQPAAVGGEHAIGLEDVTVLAAAGDVARRQQLVDRALHGIDRTAQTRELGLRVLGNELMDQNTRLVPHGGADAEPRVEAHAVRAHPETAQPPPPPPPPPAYQTPPAPPPPRPP